MTTDPETLRAELIRRAQKEAEVCNPDPERSVQEPMFRPAQLRNCRACSTSTHTRASTCARCGGPLE